MAPIQHEDSRDTILWLFGRINVLLVMDGIAGSAHYASFGPGDQTADPNTGDAFFGLSEFVRVLTSGWFPRFNVTKAHRDTDVNGAADVENFKFDAVDLSVYDEIWLFGVADTGGTANAMTDSELVALTKFMNGGGGVFATGDHADLGVELNGRVPRVRSMRKWYFPGPGPLGEPGAPPPVGSARVETTQRGAGETFTHFDDQSDDIPQPLRLRWYVNSFSRFFLSAYPHPVMCGLKGPITVAPDHMHEGEVITPWDLTATLTFAGQNFVEYPKDGTGRQWPPEIIAWGQVLAETNISTEGAHVGDPTDVATPRTFGVVGAYDGQRVGIGRVVVDSTWHHFFDINLIGDPIAPYPKTLGFKASPSGQAVLSDIETYYRNIAYWIARPGSLWLLWPGLAWAAVKSQPLNMILNPRHEYNYADTLRIGALGLENLYRFLPPCFIFVILWKYLVEGPVRVVPPDPWAGPQPGPGDPVFVNPAAILEAALGGSVIAIETERAQIEKMAPEKAVEAIKSAVNRGVGRGLRELGTDMGRYAEGLEKIARGWTNPERK
jgi:hypothetical protein